MVTRQGVRADTAPVAPGADAHPVVGGDDQHRPLPQPARAQTAHDLAEDAIGEADLEQVALHRLHKPEPVAAPREAPKVEDAAPAEPPKAEPQKAVPSKAAAKAPEVVPVTATASAPAARPPGTRTVTLRFRGTSWVEIRDRSGKVLLSKLNEAGSEAEVSGRPPFQVVVGNAPEVTMLYDDRVFPLEPHTKVAVARFTLE